MIKKILYFCVCFILLCNCVCTVFVYAEERNEKNKDAVIVYASKATKINAVEYSETSSASVTVAADGLFINPLLQWASYEIYVQQAGEYIITMSGRVLNDSYITSELLIDDERLCSLSFITLAGDNTAQGVKSRVVELPAGKHTFKVKPQGGSGLVLREIMFERVCYTDAEVSNENRPFRNFSLPCRVQSEDFDYGSAGNVSLDNINAGKRYRNDIGIDVWGSERDRFYIELKQGERVQYTLNVDRSDVYAFSMAAPLSNKGSGVAVYFDDYPNPLKLSYNAENPVVNIYIPKGVHKMKVEPYGEDINIDYFDFKCTEGDYVTLDKLDIIPFAEKKEEVKVVNPVYKNLYVSPNGDDSGKGNMNSPFLTLKRVKEEIEILNDNMSGDIVVNIAPGYYQLTETEIFGVEHSGKNGYNIIFRGEDKDNPPLISGGVEVVGWEKYNDLFWRAKVPDGVETVRNLYINNMPSTRARSKYSYSVTGVYNDPETEFVKDGFYMDYNNFPKNISNPCDVELVWPLVWACHYTPVEDIIIDHEAKTVLYKVNGYSISHKTGNAEIDMNSGKTVIIENAMELLDEPGEFCYNSKEGYIYYYPFKAEDMTTAKAYVGKVESLFEIEGESFTDRVTNIIFDNLDIRYGAWDRTSKYGFMVTQGDSVRGVESVEGADNFMLPAQITIQKATGIEIRNCRITCQGSSAISIPNAATDIELVGNLIADCSGTGVEIGHWGLTDDYQLVNDILVKNNVIWRVAGEYRNALGISLYYAKDVDISHNDLYFLPYCGMQIGWGWGTVRVEGHGGIEVMNNKIERAMTSLKDGSDIYMNGFFEGAEVGYNYLTRSIDQRFAGVYFDAGTSYVRSHHNVVTESPGWFHWSGFYSIHSNRVDSYYSDTEEVTGWGDNFAIDFTWATVFDKENVPDEAQDIMNNAGVEEEYKYLISLAEEPQWKVNRLETAKKQKYRSLIRQSKNWIEAEDFLSGENVGWYKITPLFNQNNYRPEEGVSLIIKDDFTAIDTNFPGEWVKYEFEVPEDGQCYFDLSYAHAWSENNIQPKVNIYIDDELTFKEVPLPKCAGWEKFEITKLGDATLSKGKHTLKLEILGNGFYIDAFRIHDGADYELSNQVVHGNEAQYDDGKIVLEQ